MQQGSSAAALTVINTRDILLQSMAAELAKEAHVQHEVWLGCHSSLSNKGQGKSKRCFTAVSGLLRHREADLAAMKSSILVLTACHACRK